MKALIGIASLCMLLAATLPARSVAATDVDARNIVNAYFEALKTGDVATIKIITSGDLLRKRSRLLDNPSYPEHLITAYQSASFVITDVSKIGNDRYSVKATIQLNANEQLPRTYTVESSTGASTPELRVVDEENI